MAKRGRPCGTGGPTHWARNPANVAAHHASVLMELWLAAAPIIEVAKLSSWSPEHQAIIEECWTKRGCQRRYTVPKAIKLKLCELAIAHVMSLHQQSEDARPQIEESLQRALSSAKAELRTRKRANKKFKKPSVDKVFEVVTRRAPANTLRRKAHMSCG